MSSGEITSPISRTIATVDDKLKTLVLVQKALEDTISDLLDIGVSTSSVRQALRKVDLDIINTFELRECKG